MLYRQEIESAISELRVRLVINYRGQFDKKYIFAKSHSVPSRWTDWIIVATREVLINAFNSNHCQSSKMAL